MHALHPGDHAAKYGTDENFQRSVPQQFFQFLRLHLFLFVEVEHNLVYYPGLPEHPGYEIMKKQARGFGSMITFQVDSKEHALQILKQVRMIKFAESLGGVETLITYPTTQTHADVPEEVRLKNGITPCTLRLSTGIVDIEDLLGELSEVFASLQ